MFGFKSKRVRKLEADKYALECELRDAVNDYKRLCESFAFHKSLELKIVPLKCVSLIDNQYPLPSYLAEEMAKERIIEELAKAVADYADFMVVGDDMVRGARRMEATIRVVENEKGVAQEG